MTQRKIHRRRFLQLSGATTAALVLAACDGLELEVISEEPAAAAEGKEEAPKQVVMEEAEVPSQYSESPRLFEVTIAQLQKEMAAGARTAASITESYLADIAAIDADLRSVIETNPDAPKIAAQLDRERAAGQLRGPLHGIPILLKDNIDTADQMQTTAGSLARLAAGARCNRRGRAAAGRRGHPGQSQPERTVQLPRLQLDQRLERARWPVPQPLRFEPQPVRLQFWLGRGGQRQPGGRRAGHGDRQLARLPGPHLRHRRHQTNGRPQQPRRRHPHLAHAGYGRADGAHRC